MNVLLTIFKIAGSLGLFLYGMQILSDGLQKSAGSKMKSVVRFMTGSRLMAIITGMLVTVMIQSSSATTVMVVSFVNAGLMTFVESIGVIIGANIGTTVTGWIIALIGFKMDITIVSLIAIAFSLPMMFSKKLKFREISEIFLGLGLLFIGLNYLQKSMPDLSGHTQVLAFLQGFEDGSLWSILVCVVIGTVITMIVQASAATMAITITMAFNGWIGVWAATALCLGQNIGTTITAYLASIGTNTNAKRTAMAHILFNVIGTVIALIFLKPMMLLVNAVTVGDIFSMSGEALNNALPTFLAGFHTCFNLLNAIIFFPFVKQFAAIVEKIVPMKEEYQEDTYHFKYIASMRIDTPEMYLITVKEEMVKMADLAVDMFKHYTEVFKSTDKDFIMNEVKYLKGKEEYADQMQEQLIDFCVQLQQDSSSPVNPHSVNALIRSIDEIESVTDSIYNLTKISEDRFNKELVFEEEDMNDILSYHSLAERFLEYTKQNINNHSFKMLKEAHDLEHEMNDEHRRLVSKVHERIQAGEGNVKAELMLLEVERHLEHVGDYCLNIAEATFSEPKHTPSLQKVSSVTELF